MTSSTPGTWHKRTAPHHAADLRFEWLDALVNQRLVRVIIDARLWNHDAAAPDPLTVLRGIRAHVREVAAFVDTVICPAGLVTVAIEAPEDVTIPKLTARSLDWGTGPAMLFGLDGVLTGRGAVVQTFARIARDEPAPESMIHKCYPAPGEGAYLYGWLREQAQPGAMANERRMQVIAGRDIATLVCHEVVAFSGRARANRGPALERVAEQLERMSEPASHIVAGIHSVGLRDGNSFKSGIHGLRALGRIVIPTMFASKEPRAVANRFAVESSAIATLLVRMT